MGTYNLYSWETINKFAVTKVVVCARQHDIIIDNNNDTGGVKQGTQVYYTIIIYYR